MKNLLDDLMNKIEVDIQCPICGINYNSTSIRPVLICQNEHYICKCCFTQKLLPSSKSCVICRQERINVFGKVSRTMGIVIEILQYIKTVMDRQKIQKSEEYKLYLKQERDNNDKLVKKLKQKQELFVKLEKDYKKQIEMLEARVQFLQQENDKIQSRTSLKKVQSSKNTLSKFYVQPFHENQILRMNQSKMATKKLNNLQNLQASQQKNVEVMLSQANCDTWAQLEKMSWLQIDRGRLVTLPEKLGQLSSLTTIVLRNGNLVCLPKSIGRLSILQVLDLQGNKIEDLPQELYSLKELQHIYLGRNRLNKLDEEIGRLRKLTHLSINRNNIKVLPISFQYLNKLKLLKFSFGKELVQQITFLIKSKNLPYLNQIFLESGNKEMENCVKDLISICRSGDISLKFVDQ